MALITISIMIINNNDNLSAYYGLYINPTPPPALDLTQRQFCSEIHLVSIQSFPPF